MLLSLIFSFFEKILVILLFLLKKIVSLSKTWFDLWQIILFLSFLKLINFLKLILKNYKNNIDKNYLKKYTEQNLRLL